MSYSKILEFTFAVITYNSEKFILYTLESIKYQITKYGKKKKIYFIISDDASKDKTVTLIKSWIERNNRIFETYEVIENSQNEGTVANYNKVISKIKTQYFHIIAGDDLYTHNNLFEVFFKLKKDICLTSVPYTLMNDKLIFEKSRFLRLINLDAHKHDNATFLTRKIILGAYLHTPSTIFFKEMYDENTKGFVKEFKLFEDDPKWYMFMKNKKKFDYYFTPIIIYREHEQSVCHNRSNKITIFDWDRIRLMSYYIKDPNANFLIKKIIKSKILKALKIKTLDYNSIYRALDLIHNYLLFYTKPYYRTLYKSIILNLNEEKKYLKKLNMIVNEIRKD